MTDKESLSPFRPDGWLLVGSNSRSSLIVRLGERPAAISVSHPDASVLLELIRDANKGLGIKDD